LTGSAAELIEATNHYLKGEPGCWQLSGAPGMQSRTWSPSEVGPVAHIMGFLELKICDFLITTPHQHVRKCANQACVLWFYDNSRNHSRQWCSMAQCGNREKAAAHRAKLRRK
jgi:predicted RNA-binding Zn ribbon-like protein